MAKYNPNARRRSRRYALQAVYQWQVANTSITDLLLQYKRDKKFAKADEAYFEKIITAATTRTAEYDDLIKPHATLSIEAISPIELAVLRIACVEFKLFDDVPYRVIINEALELTKEFGTQEGYRFVNGVLDTLAKTVRENET